MKLFEVVRKFYVMAETESDAELFQPLDALSCTNDVYEAKTVDSEWWDAIPFGSQKGDETCGQILINSRRQPHE